MVLTSAAEPTGAPAPVEVPGTLRLLAVEPVDRAACVRTADRDKSVARLWDEALRDTRSRPGSPKAAYASALGVSC